MRQLEHPRPSVVVVLDMVGDKDLDIYYEQNSYNVAKNIVEHIWDGAAKVGATGFHAEPRHNVYDDHAPFIEAGIPGVNLIDFDYGLYNRYWHTNDDTIDKLSPESFAIILHVLDESIRELEKRP